MRYGPPVKTGPNVPQLNALPGLNSGYAKFDGVWDFPRIPRQMHFITLADAKGGVGGDHVYRFLATQETADAGNDRRSALPDGTQSGLLTLAAPPWRPFCIPSEKNIAQLGSRRLTSLPPFQRSLSSIG